MSENQVNNIDHSSIITHPLLPALLSTNVYTSIDLNSQIDSDKNSKLINGTAEFYNQLREQSQQGNNEVDQTLTEILLKMIALETAHKQEIDSLSALCDNYIEKMCNTLKLNQSGPGGSDSKEAFTDFKRKFNSNHGMPGVASTSAAGAAGSSVSAAVAAAINGINPNMPGLTSGPIGVTTTSANVGGSGSSGVGVGGGGKKKKKNFNKEATDALNMWFFNHLHDPYPTDEEKKLLAAQTNLSLSQVNNWFGNKRMRYKRKMLEQNRRAAASGGMPQPGMMGGDDSDGDSPQQGDMGNTNLIWQ